MTHSPSQHAELHDLVDAVCENGLTAAALDRLEPLLLADDGACRYYLDYIRLHGSLMLAAEQPTVSGWGKHSCLPLGAAVEWGRHSCLPIGAALELPQQLGAQHSPFVIEPSPPIHYPLSTIHYVLFSYLMATLIVGLGLLIGSWWKVSDPASIALLPSPAGSEGGESANLPSPTGRVPGGEGQVVGRITGMVDCQWAEKGTVPFCPPGGLSPFPPKGSTSSNSQISKSPNLQISKSPVSLGDHFSLSSGLLEITYNTGAKVILQGPVNYQVESNGGFLSLGKLTGKLEKKVASELHPSSFILHPSSNPQSLIPNPFCIRTPNAVVTDLGTEFGVEVPKEGVTETNVFVGAVQVTAIGGKDASDGRSRIIRAGQFAHVAANDGRAIAVGQRRLDVMAQRLVREMPRTRLTADDYAELVLSMKPFAYYRMEPPAPYAKDPNAKEAMVLFDSAPGGHHGTAHTGVEYPTGAWTKGRFGGALYLGGEGTGDYAVVEDLPATGTDRISVSAWVYSLRPARGGFIATESDQRHGDNEGLAQFGMGIDAAGVFWAAVLQRDGGMAYQLDETSRKPFPAGRWQHVACVADGNVLHLYRNGVEVGAQPCKGVRKAPPIKQFTIGCLNVAHASDPPHMVVPHGCWVGRIDELAIFNHALSAAEIHQLFDGQRYESSSAKERHP
jgi:hypothetical protein